MHSFVHESLANVIFGTIVLIISPILLICSSRNKRDRERSQGIRRPYGKLPRKLPRRRRALSIISRGPVPEHCGLLTIPLEIRLLIWTECMGNNSFHIYVPDGQLGGSICKSPTPRLCFGLGRGRACRAETTENSVDEMAFSGLAILQTCRTM